MASVLVRLRARSDVEVRGQEEAPELPYSPPVKRALVTENQSEVRSETLLQPREMSVIMEEEESDQYEEVYVLKSGPS